MGCTEVFGTRHIMPVASVLDLDLHLLPNKKYVYENPINVKVCRVDHTEYNICKKIPSHKILLNFFLSNCKSFQLKLFTQKSTS